MNIGNEKSRGYYKIKGAARAFDFDFLGKIVLDIGSSTGGFTEYALEHGAKKVIAVEKGTGQMKSPLKGDPRVELHEKTDIFGVGIASSEGIRSAAARGVAPSAHGRPPEEVRERRACSSFRSDDERTTRRVDGPDGRGPRKETIPTPDVILADVSFLPLTKILEYAKINLSRSNTDFLVMLKPQFETTNPNDLNRGVVKNETIRRRIIKNFEAWLKAHGFLIIKKRDNDLEGKHGNVERFYHLRLAK